MLIGSVIVYLLVTIAIGLWAAQRVHNSKDYVLAGRSLPLYMNTATVFATWFGAESVLSVSVEFSKSGLSGIIADPFGSSMCLVIVALFFARAFYRMDLLTIGDFYTSAGPPRSSPRSAWCSRRSPMARYRSAPASFSAA